MKTPRVGDTAGYAQLNSGKYGAHMNGFIIRIYEDGRLFYNERDTASANLRTTPELLLKKLQAIVKDFKWGAIQTLSGGQFIKPAVNPFAAEQLPVGELVAVSKE